MPLERQQVWALAFLTAWLATAALLEAVVSVLAPFVTTGCVGHFRPWGRSQGEYATIRVEQASNPAREMAMSCLHSGLAITIRERSALGAPDEERGQGEASLRPNISTRSACSFALPHHG